MGVFFGTDGVRGLANDFLTPELALALASSTARVLTDPAGARRPVAVVGRDPRASGEMLEAAVVAGLTSAGVDVLRVGVLPTPAIAFLTADYNADLGIVLSASHNPMPDNGFKVFTRGGEKLDDDLELAIEADMVAGPPARRPVGAGVGRVHDGVDAADRYLNHLADVVVPKSLAGLHVVVDCSHGSASTVAPRAYRQAGATVTVLAAEPDGLNINDGVGSTHIESLAAAVTRLGADLGIAHDGDADRCLAVSADGELVDGDQILALCALRLRAMGRLPAETVVATVMSNLGFHQAMQAAGIKVITTAVGDRYVLEALREHGLPLGGEQSGHVIFTDYATTGDGLLTALNVMAGMVETGQSLAQLARIVRRLPQVLINVNVKDKEAVATSSAVRDAVAEAEATLGGDGRVLMRPSGTEQLVRVMVEAASLEQAQSLADRVAAVVAAS